MSLLALTETQREIQTLARSFAARELAPLAGERDRESRFDRSMVEQMAELGFFGMLIPEQYDGLGLDANSYLLALRRSRGGASGRCCSACQLAADGMILNFGNDAQRDRFLPPWRAATCSARFALAEPEAGSEARRCARRQRARRRMDLTGTKPGCRMATKPA